MSPREPETLETVAAVVVTYNRIGLLMECLHALLQQTRQVDAIYVVDNNSQDETSSKIAALLHEFSHIHYVRLNENAGGAGGFACGLAAARMGGYDWYWLMDDDVEPYPDALAALLRYKNQSECIHGVRTAPDGSRVDWGGHLDRDRVVVRPLDFPYFRGEDDVVEVTVGCFEGMLISNRVVSKIGYPDREFFICWDDTLYGYLASKETAVVYVNVLSLRRKRNVDISRSLMLGDLVKYSDLALFYWHRNRYLVARAVRSRRMIFARESLKIYIKSIVKEWVLHCSWRRVILVHRGTLQGLQLWLASR